jgi:predicted transcriptional regulator
MLAFPFYPLAAWRVIMDKSVSDFLSGFTNVCEGNFTIGREKKNNSEYLVITYEGREMYTFWHNPQNKETNKPKKHTGGKPSYVKFMLEEVRKHKELSIDVLGFFVKIADNIQWSSNLLIETRSKKPLTADGISKIINLSKSRTYEIIKELNEARLLSKDKDGYKISSNLIQKGGAKK